MSSQAMVLVNSQYSNQVLQIDYRPWWVRDFRLPQSTFGPWRLLISQWLYQVKASWLLKKPEPGGHLHSIFCTSLHFFLAFPWMSAIQSGRLSPPIWSPRVVSFFIPPKFLKAFFFLIKKSYILTVTLIQIMEKA